MRELRGARVLVLGLGRSGRAAAAFCARHGAHVLAADEHAAQRGALPAEVELRAGAPFPDPAEFDVVVPSPGVPRERYAERARRVIPEIDLAAAALPVPIVAVTGTNGKSTAVTLTAALLRADGIRARAAGNLGEPALSLVGEPLDVAVLEVSSFQLESSERFHPRVGVVLNVSEDHLDRHGTLERYAAAKARLFALQDAGDVAIANGDDALARDCLGETRAQRWLFRSGGPVECGGWWDAGAVVLREGGRSERHVVDPATVENASVRLNLLPALLAARAAGADVGRALAALPRYAALPHRLERVARLAGVDYVNDSKATNPGAAEQALAAQPGPVVWIAGGRDKGLSFESLAEAALGRARHAILIGEAADKLAAALRGRVPCERAPDLETAVTLAAARAVSGDVVLLAPACSSFDQFASFEERGERFRAAVLALEEPTQ